MAATTLAVSCGSTGNRAGSPDTGDGTGMLALTGTGMPQVPQSAALIGRGEPQVMQWAALTLAGSG